MDKTFNDLDLSINSLKAIEKKGITIPTEVQIQTIPLIMEGKKDLLVQAQTGTGKTAAFAIPILEKLIQKEYNQVLIMSPTRELAIQLSAEILSFCGRKKIKIALLYGGQSYDSQVKRLSKQPEIIIGTPGRLHEHIDRKSYLPDTIKYLILDEVDEMLKAGFADDIELVLKKSNRSRKTYFFSATIPEKINNLSKVYTKKLQKIIVNKKKINNLLSEQIYFEMFSHDKLESLIKILSAEPNFYGIIFCKSRLKAKHLSINLNKKGYNSGAIHGDLAQDIREQVIGKFRQKKIMILTATDVAARGLDIPNLSHIINYSIPDTPDIYVHRIGRTARAGRKGIAVTFVTPEESFKFSRIKNTLRQNITKMDFSSEEINTEKKEEKQIEKISERLFIALGTKNSITPDKLLELIKKKTEVPSERISNLFVGDLYSFFTVSILDAKHILNVFKGTKNGKRKMVEIATGEASNQKENKRRTPPKNDGEASYVKKKKTAKPKNKDYWKKYSKRNTSETTKSEASYEGKRSDERKGFRKKNDKRIEKESDVVNFSKKKYSKIKTKKENKGEASKEKKRNK